MTKLLALPLASDVGEARGTPAPAGTEIPDRLLMARIAAGDQTSFSLLIQRYWPQVVSFTGRLAGSLDTGEDIAQEVFVRIWENREQWEPSGSVRAYLFRIARNLAADEHRRRESRRRSAPEVRSLHVRADLPAQAAERAELKQALNTAVDRLPARRREVFILVHYQGLSYREVAAIMDIAVSTVANQLSAALVELRQELRRFVLPA